MIGTPCGRLTTDHRPPTTSRIHYSHCDVRGRNYRLQDIQLSKITRGIASPEPPHAVARGAPRTPLRSRAARPWRASASQPLSRQPLSSLARGAPRTPLRSRGARSRAPNSVRRHRLRQLRRLACRAVARSLSPAARLRASRSGAAAFACNHERRLVENTGLEPVTSWLQTRRSPS